MGPPPRFGGEWQLMKSSLAAFALPRQTLDSSPSTHCVAFLCLAQEPCFTFQLLSASPSTPDPFPQAAHPMLRSFQLLREEIAAPSAHSRSRPTSLSRPPQLPFPAPAIPPPPPALSAPARLPAPPASPQRCLPSAPRPPPQVQFLPFQPGKTPHQLGPSPLS